VSREQVAGFPQGWKGSLNGKTWELAIWLRISCWRNLAETVNQAIKFLGRRDNGGVRGRRDAILGVTLLLRN
jgi:hypothetical protein